MTLDVWLQKFGYSTSLTSARVTGPSVVLSLTPPLPVDTLATPASCNGVASVSVLHQDCMAADAWSTALSVLGPEQGIAFAEARDLAARFLVRRNGVLDETCSSAFRALLQ